jgi:hypothetical protein
MIRDISRLCLLLALVALAVVPASAQDLFPQAQSADRLRQASGLIWDTTVLDEPPHWTFDGEFALRCEGGRCATAALETIRFDMALTMVRPDGANSHSHTFTDFVATDVTVNGDDLVIGGTIIATGGIGFTPIVITLQGVTQQSTLLVEFPDNGHAVGPIGGVVVTSR